MTDIFNQKHYSETVKALDEAFAVFRAVTPSDSNAEAAFKDFIVNHYFPVWRKINPPGEKPAL